MQFFCGKSFQKLFEKYIDIHNYKWYYKTMKTTKQFLKRVKAVAEKVNSIIDLIIQLEEMNRKPQLVSDAEVEAKVKEIYGKPEYIEKQKKARSHRREQASRK